MVDTHLSFELPLTESDRQECMQMIPVTVERGQLCAALGIFYHESVRLVVDTLYEKYLLARWDGRPLRLLRGNLKLIEEFKSKLREDIDIVLKRINSPVGTMLYSRHLPLKEEDVQECVKFFPNTFDYKRLCSALGIFHLESVRSIVELLYEKYLSARFSGKNLRRFLKGNPIVIEQFKKYLQKRIESLPLNDP